MEPAARAFDRSYRETVVLPSGLQVVLRSIRPEDKQTLVRALGQLSPQSRYLRFFTNKSHFTDAELRYLTEVDGENHFAIAAMRVMPDGSEEGLGIARVVRCADEPTVAEAAVAVIDEVQRQGLGRVLFMRLALAARERGIERIRSEILAENRAIRAIIRQFAPEARLKHDGYLITVDAPLPELDRTPRPEARAALNPNYRLLALAARNALELRHNPYGPSSTAPPPPEDAASEPKGEPTKP